MRHYRQWQRLNGKGRRNVVRVSQERTLEGRLFQIAGAVEGKPWSPDEMLQRVTDRSLAQADRRVLHGMCHWTRLSRYGGGGYRCNTALWINVAILNLIRSWTGNESSWLKVARLEQGLWLAVTTRARVFWVRWRREIYFAGMPYVGQSLHSDKGSSDSTEESNESRICLRARMVETRFFLDMASLYSDAGIKHNTKYFNVIWQWDSDARNVYRNLVITTEH